MPKKPDNKLLGELDFQFVDSLLLRPYRTLTSAISRCCVRTGALPLLLSMTDVVNETV